MFDTAVRHRLLAMTTGYSLKNYQNNNNRQIFI